MIDSLRLLFMHWNKGLERAAPVCTLVQKLRTVEQFLVRGRVPQISDMSVEDSDGVGTTVCEKSYDDAHSLLEMLYYYYTAGNPVDNAVIRCQLKELNDVLSYLPLSENDAVFSFVVDLCITHERQAFLDGVHVGMRLFSELNELPSDVQGMDTLPCPCHGAMNIPHRK